MEPIPLCESPVSGLANEDELKLSSLRSQNGKETKCTRSRSTGGPKKNNKPCQSFWMTQEKWLKGSSSGLWYYEVLCMSLFFYLCVFLLAFDNF